MMPFFDVAYKSINKQNEELCGDHVEIHCGEKEMIAVLSDGLGSGVKANILATLTSKIAITMLREGADLAETIDTIVNTLPTCQVRKLAYSTFTIVKIDEELNLYVAEYDNPPIFIYRDGYLLPIERKEVMIQDKKIYESRTRLKIGDMISVVSDGAVHAGVGALLNLGWQWKDINLYLNDLNRIEKTARLVANNFINVCNTLYDDKPGDDTTIMTIKVREPEFVDLFTGPPSHKEIDGWIIQKLEHAMGKKIICGGTTANIASRELKRALVVDLKTMTPEVPPIARMDGYDLITEGVLTLQKALGKIKRYSDDDDIINRDEDGDAAERLARMLIEDCTHLNIWFGQAVNPAHQNPDFPIDFNIKLRIISEIIDALKQMGKKVDLTYI